MKHINKHCDKKGKESCIDEITVLSPQNDSVSAVGDQVGHPDTTFTDIYDNTVAIHTSCSRCIYEGKEIEGWTIVEIIDDGTLAEKCDLPVNINTAKRKNFCIFIKVTSF